MYFAMLPVAHLHCNGLGPLTGRTHLQLVVMMKSHNEEGVFYALRVWLVAGLQNISDICELKWKSFGGCFTIKDLFMCVGIQRSDWS